MQVTVIARRSVFEDALAAAEQIGKPGQLKGLNAPLDAALRGRLSDAWDAIKEALGKAYEMGREKAQPYLEQAWRVAEEAVAGAGSKARELEDALLARLQEYLVTFVDRLLAQVRPAIRVGETTLSLKQVQLSQRVMLSRSLKVSIQEVCALTSDGELTVAADYAV